MEIIKNPINLRLATVSEKKIAETMITPAEERKTGYSYYWEMPEHVLVSDTAFPGELSFYAAVEQNGKLDSCGWIGKA